MSREHCGASKVEQVARSRTCRTYCAVASVRYRNSCNPAFDSPCVRSCHQLDPNFRQHSLVAPGSSCAERCAEATSPALLAKERVKGALGQVKRIVQFRTMGSCFISFSATLSNPLIADIFKPVEQFAGSYCLIVMKIQAGTGSLSSYKTARRRSEHAVTTRLKILIQAVCPLTAIGLSLTCLACRVM